VVDVLVNELYGKKGRRKGWSKSWYSIHMYVHPNINFFKKILINLLWASYEQSPPNIPHLLLLLLLLRKVACTYVTFNNFHDCDLESGQDRFALRYFFIFFLFS
jgi:hypothetical protein